MKKMKVQKNVCSGKQKKRPGLHLHPGNSGGSLLLFTADGYEGEIIPCNEGVLEWIRKEDLLKLNLWEGDKIFLKLLQENAPFFSLKLAYKGDVLTEAVLDGKKLKKS